MTKDELKAKYNAYKNGTALSGSAKDQFNESVKLYGENRYEEAMKILIPLAQQGAAAAQFNLAVFYKKGLGVPKDEAKAVEWYIMAAQQGDIQAQLNLGTCYAQGEGVPENKEKAIEWWSKAAAQGDTIAWENLETIKADPRFEEAENLIMADDIAFAYGRESENGKEKGMKIIMTMVEEGDAYAQYYLALKYEKDEKKAFELYRKSAQQGYAPAQCELGFCYFIGNGVKEDKEEAVKWLRKAAEQGYSSAMFKLTKCYYEGEGISKDINTAREWSRKAAIGFYNEAASGNNNADLAQYNLAECYEMNEDYKEAFEWYSKASKTEYESDGKRAMYKLGDFYNEGKGVNQDSAKAVEWYAKAAKNDWDAAREKLNELAKTGNNDAKNALNKMAEKSTKDNSDKDAQAQNELGDRYYKGDGVKKDLTKAFECFLKAAQMGHTEAIYNVAVHYFNGEGVKQDRVKADEWYFKAAKQGHDDAQYETGLRQKTHSESAEWYLKAAQQGHSKAQYEMGNMYYLGFAYSKDYNKAIEWYEKAAKQGHEKAQGMYEKLKIEMNDGTLDTNELYHKGVTYKDKRDYIKAAEYFTKAIQNGCVLSMHELGKCYYEGGIGFPKDEKKAYELVSKAAQNGKGTFDNWYILRTLADYYKWGVGTAQNYEKAIECYQECYPFANNNENRKKLDEAIKECQKELKKQKGLFGGLFGKK